jgi:molecular chaperone DnaJ
MDLYTLLGVSRTASVADIERAYRRLARRYHPGVNPGDRVSHEMYQRVQDAYDVLRDTARRHDYDRGGAENGSAEPAPVAFAGFDFSAAAEGPMAATFTELFADVFQQAAREATAPTRGPDLELSTRVSFREAMRGTETTLSVTRHERCGTCQGRGLVRRAAASCPACGGSGTQRWARGHLVFAKACDACAGRGRIDAEACRACLGIGTAPRTEVITLPLPAGVDNGARIAVPGRGHAGARGGPAGDLYVTVEVAEDRHFTRRGRDLLVTVPIGVDEAALGGRIDVPTLEGAVTITIPPGTASGQELRLRGRGIGRADDGRETRGDLVVTMQIALPAVLDEASRNLLRQFGRLNTADVRRHLFD